MDNQEEINQLRSDITFLLAFVPDWAKTTSKGLDPTFYGTLTYEGDLEVSERVSETINRQGGCK